MIAEPHCKFKHCQMPISNFDYCDDHWAVVFNTIQMDSELARPVVSVPLAGWRKQSEKIALFVGKSFGRVIEGYEKVFDIQVEDPLRLLKKQAELAQAKGDGASLIASLQKIIQLEGPHPKTLTALGIAWLKNQQPAAALEAFSQAINLQELDEIGTFYLGIAYFELADWGLAARQFESIVEKKDFHVAAFYRLGKIYQKLGRLEEAKNTLLQGLAVFSAPKISQTLGDIYEAQGEKKLAAGYFKQTILLHNAWLA